MLAVTGSVTGSRDAATPSGRGGAPLDQMNGGDSLGTGHPPLFVQGSPHGTPQTKNLVRSGA